MCNWKNHYRPKKCYSHGRTGRTADDGPEGAYKKIVSCNAELVYICGYTNVTRITVCINLLLKLTTDQPTSVRQASRRICHNETINIT